jgi:hypothetical protein
LKQTAPAPPSTSRLGPLVWLDEVTFNAWNPNRMDGWMYARAVESIETFGMIDPILVRELPNGNYEVIDGEHRAKACLDLEQPIPAHSVGIIPDALAKKMTIALNEVHGTASPIEMGKLLDDLLTSMPLDDLLEGLPFSPETVKAFTATADIDWAPEPAPARLASNDKERWVERTYRLPASVAAVLDQAIDRARDAFGDGRDHTEAECLEVVAAEYLAG